MAGSLRQRLQKESGTDKNGIWRSQNGDKMEPWIRDRYDRED